MNTRRIGVIVTVLALISIAIYGFMQTRTYHMYRAESFLGSLWIDALQLYREHPTADTVWLIPDNYLIQHYQNTQLLLHDLDATPYPWQGRVEVLAGHVLSFPLNDVESEFIETQGDYDVYTERQGDILLDWNASADLLGYTCLSYLNCEDCDHNWWMAAYHLWQFAVLWDGHGFNDHDFKQEGQYAVYKNALYAYCFKQFTQYSENHGSDHGSHQSSEWAGWITIQKILPRAEIRLWNAWDSGTGGFYSHYWAGNYTAEVNAETTAWVLLAYA